MTRSLRGILVMLLCFGSACSTCQQSISSNPPACNPQVGDPTPDSSGRCAPIGGVQAVRVCINRCKAVAQVGQPCTNNVCADGGAVCDLALTCSAAGVCVHSSTNVCDPQKSAIDNGCEA